MIPAAAVTETLARQGWWIASRASGIVALVLVTISVLIGLTMAGKPISRPGLGKALFAIHQQTALAALIAIAVHGFSLLLDPWLKPGIVGVTVPFALGLHTFWTGLGVIAGYLAVLLGLGYYARRRIGARLWRKAHRATIAVWALGVFHALGAGTDTGSVWFESFVLLSALPVSLLFVYRLGAGARAERRRELAARARRRAGAVREYEQSLITR